MGSQCVRLSGALALQLSVSSRAHHLFMFSTPVTYTGNSTIARVVAKAAAEHLTPLVLELGGKAPVVIDPNTTDLKIAAKRILWGKTLNAGQVSGRSATRRKRRRPTERIRYSHRFA